MYFSGSIKNLKGENVKDATVDVVRVPICV